MQPFIDLRTGELKAEVSSHSSLVLCTNRSGTRQMRMLVMLYRQFVLHELHRESCLL